MGLFGRSPEKQAREAAARAELDRLTALSPDALAAEILPAMASDELTKHLSGVRVQDICKALMGGVKVPMAVNTGVLLLPVKEGLQRLEHANLVTELSSNIDKASRWRITTTGEQTLAANDVAQKLG
jgi:hypothetical protein